MAIPVRVFVRTDVAWDQMDLERFERQDDPTRPLSFIRRAQQQRFVERFQEVFGFDFFRFRAAMKAIGTASLDRVEGARLTLGFERFDEWLDDPEEELVFPIDDDDIFHPELASLAERLNPETSIVLWRYTKLGHPLPLHPLWHRIAPAVLMSNNWGVRKSFLQTRLSRDEAREFLSDHGEAHCRMLRLLGQPVTSEHGPLGPFFSGLDAPEVMWIDQCFSVHLVHPASLTQAIIDSVSWKRLEALEIERVGSLSEALDWARPFVRRYDALLDELLLARASRAQRSPESTCER